MKHIHTFIVSLCAFLGMPAMAFGDSLYVIPADASGNIVKTSDGDYPGKLIFTEGPDEVFTINSVELPSGKFAIYAYADDTGYDTFYSIPPWAVSPVPPSYPNPLMIATSGTLMSVTEPGIYDLEFYSRNIEGITTHMLILTPQSEGTAKYPSQLYLVGTSSGTSVSISGNPHEGIYYGFVTPPDEFKISYEPRISEDAFIFGAADGSTGNIVLEADRQTPIKYATGTDAVFSVSPSALKAQGAHIVVNLPAGYIKVHSEIPTGVSVPEVEGITSAYYTLAGTRLLSNPTTPGIYIQVRGGKTMKVMVR